MNLEQIIEEINKDLDDTFDNGELIGWINRCIDDLTPFAKIKKVLLSRLYLVKKHMMCPLIL
jgi:hypothetical protein